MIKPICERNGTCLFLIKEIKDYEYVPFPRKDFVIKGKQSCYYCNNPKKFDSWRLPKELTHEEKFKGCSFKVTNKLEEFINVTKI